MYIKFGYVFYECFSYVCDLIEFSTNTPINLSAVATESSSSSPAKGENFDSKLYE